MTSDVQLSEPASELLQTAEEVAPRWLRRCVNDTARRAGHDPADLADEIAAVTDHASRELLARLAALLATDVDEQRSNPLSLFRDAVRGPTELLLRHGVTLPPADRFTTEHFPDDVYGLGPATWSDVDPRLEPPGIAWGAWKAMTVLRRRRDEGVR